MLTGLIIGILLLTLVGLLFLVCFAYMLWIMAGRETGNNRILGQGLAVVVAALAVILFFYTALYAGAVAQQPKHKMTTGEMRMPHSGCMFDKHCKLDTLAAGEKIQITITKLASAEAVKSKCHTPAPVVASPKAPAKTKSAVSKCTKKPTGAKSSKSKK